MYNSFSKYLGISPFSRVLFITCTLDILRVCVFVCMCVCVFMCVFMCVHTCVYMCVYVCICLCASVFLRISVRGGLLECT